MIEQKVLALCMKAHFWDRAKNILEPDMFPREWMPVVSSLFYAQKHYESDITVDELLSVHRDLNPALPESTKESTESLIHSLAEVDLPNRDIAFDVIKNFWRRDKAKHIGNKALAIWTGEGGDFAELQRLIDLAASEDVNSHETFSIVNEDLEELVKYTQRPSEFKFTLEQMSARITGMNRGDLGIIFARPEVGKSSFCAHLASHYISRGQKVHYWANEEIAEKVKLRIITAFFNIDKNTMEKQKDRYVEEYKKKIDTNLVVMDSVGTSVKEIVNFTTLNKPDVIFIDQMDKVKIDGTYTRGDERLKEIYVMGRELAKRHNCLVWAVSQASYEAHEREVIDYSMLDNSRTGKAGEADLIIGIGRELGLENNTRFLTISKNKINGWHGTVPVQINVPTGRYSV